MLTNQISKILIFMTIGLMWQPLPAIAEWSLDIHGNDIALGMDQQTVLKQLKIYRVQCLGAPENKLSECTSLLFQNNFPPYDALANVYFQNGKVKSIRKYWSHGYNGEDLGKFVQILHSLLARNNQQSVQVSVGERRDPGGFQQAIYFTSGRRTVEITYLEGMRDPIDGKVLPPFINLNEIVE